MDIKSPCVTCRGKGVILCEECRGSGHVTDPSNPDARVTCPLCHGECELPCRGCEGKGSLDSPSILLPRKPDTTNAIF
jgi:DnaJ-class molecular chaperone